MAKLLNVSSELVTVTVKDARRRLLSASRSTTKSLSPTSPPP
jgi:hypothetical protein